MKKILLIYLLLVWIVQVSSLFAQVPKGIDSLQILSASLPNDFNKISVLLQLVEYYQDNDLNKAFKFAEQADSIANKLNNKRVVCKTHFSLGNLYLLKSDLGKAKEYYYSVLKIGQEIKDDTVIAKSYNNLGKFNLIKDNYQEALDYFSKSMEINLRLQIKQEISTNYIHIGSVYNNLKQYSKAIEFYEKALKILNELNSIKNIPAICSNIGITYFKMGNTEKAIESFKNSIRIAEKVDNKKYLANATGNLATLYAMLNRYPEAIEMNNRSIEYAQASGIKDVLYSRYMTQSVLFKDQKEFLKAYQYALLASAMKDTLHQESNSRLENELSVKHESEQKELEIENLEKDSDLAETQLKQEQHLKLFLSLFVLLAAVSSFILFRRIIQKRKTNKILSAAHDQIEKKNQSITDSINYSKRIQDSILPSKQLKNELFHEIFVLYMPKDIVSGDFYWYTEKNGKKIVACCDCTGHGVPGALMSMIGNNILNQVVNEHEIISPDEILYQLNLEIRKALKQDTQSKSMDGMDLALIVFNNETEIEYAGAQRPLCIVRKISPEAACELIEIKANKVSIGGYQDEGGKKFTKHTVQLLKGDCIYMFTDGYADQFGGNNNRKFMIKRLKELLISNYSRPTAEQERSLTEAIIKWKGNEEQVDDICVIGIRI